MLLEYVVIHYNNILKANINSLMYNEPWQATSINRRVVVPDKNVR